MGKKIKYAIMGSALLRLLAFSLLWLALTGGRMDDPAVALVVIGIAALLSLKLVPPGLIRIRTAGALRFVPYFLRQSVIGGWDVARRALAPEMPVNPGFIRFELRLSSEVARVFLAWVVSLLPGTASVRLEGDSLHVHVLDTGMRADHRLRELETYVADVFMDAIRVGER